MSIQEWSITSPTDSKRSSNAIFVNHHVLSEHSEQHANVQREQFQQQQTHQSFANPFTKATISKIQFPVLCSKTSTTNSSDLAWVQSHKFLRMQRCPRVISQISFLLVVPPEFHVSNNFFKNSSMANISKYFYL